MSKADLTDFLDGLSRVTRQIVTALRSAVRRAAPGAEQTLLWGGLSYHRPKVGGRVKGAVCQIVAKRGEVRLDFIHGMRLADPGACRRATACRSDLFPSGPSRMPRGRRSRP